MICLFSYAGGGSYPILTPKAHRVIITQSDELEQKQIVDVIVCVVVMDVDAAAV